MIEEIATSRRAFEAAERATKEVVPLIFTFEEVAPFLLLAALSRLHVLFSCLSYLSFLSYSSIFQTMVVSLQFFTCASFSLNVLFLNLLCTFAFLHFVQFAIFVFTEIT